MMYKQNFIASLKAGGKILRENSGVVSLPFGSEYSILLKNLHSRRAMVSVSVDGQNATEGTKLIIPANGTVELERFIKNGNLSSGNKFKFIERTSAIEEHRGVKEDDGLIRAEFWVEKEQIDIPVVRHHYYDEWHPVRRHYHPWYDPYYPINGGITWTSGAIGSVQDSLSGQLQSGQAQCSAQIMAMNCSVQPSQARISQDFDNSMEIREASMNDAGITVPGSESHQQFQSVYGFVTESNSQVIVLQLRGKVGETKVSAPVTVDQKPVCSVCGKSNKPGDKFCRECGTSLVII